MTINRANVVPHRWRKWLTWILVSVSLVWVAYLLSDSWPDFITALQGASWRWVLTAFFLGLLGAATVGETFFLGANAIEPGAIARLHAYRLQYVAAIARNLPGRFWGVAYQIAETKNHLAVTRLILVQSILAVLTVSLTLGLSVSIITWEENKALSLFVFVCILPVCWIGHSVLRRVMRQFPTRLGRSRLIVAIVSAAHTISRVPSSVVLQILGVATVGWLLYLAGWACIGIAYPSIDSYDGLRLAAFYSLAWVVGFISLVTPSGFGVRELSFMILAAEYSPDILAFSVILGRLWFLLNDLTLGGIALIFTDSNKKTD